MRISHRKKQTRLIDFSSFQLPKLNFKWDARAGPIVYVSYGERKLGLALICHRRKSRCIEILGHRSFLCARCTGLSIGLVVSFFLHLLGLAPNEYIPQFFGLLLISPMIFDGFSQLFGMRESTNLIRLLSGLLFSLGIFAVLVK